MISTSHFSRRSVLTAIAASVATYGGFTYAQSAVWPNSKPVRLIIPNSAGSQVDIIARRLAERLGPMMNTAFVVENQPGAGGVVGTQNLMRAPKDGYTLSVVANNHVIFPHLNKTLKIDAVKDFTPIAMVGSGQLVAVTRGNHPAKSLREMLEMARKEPGKLALGHSGNGTILHLAGEQMLRMANAQMLIVPYRGVSSVLPDVISGQVDIAFFGPASVLALARDGKLRALGVSGLNTHPLFPDTPTIAQAGVPGYEMEGWICIIGPADLPVEVTQILSEAVTKLTADPTFAKVVSDAGLSVRSLRGEPLRKFFADEYASYGKLVEQAGIKAE